MSFITYLDLTISILGILFNVLEICVLLGVQDIRLSSLKATLSICAYVDLFYAISTLITLYSSTFGNNVVYFIMNNPFVPRTVFWNYLLHIQQVFWMFLSTTVISLQFVCRYGIMRGNPFSPRRMWGLLLLCVLYNVYHASLTRLGYMPPTVEQDQILRKTLNLSMNQTLPVYLYGYTTNPFLLLQLFDIGIIVHGTYAVILFMIVKSKRTITMSNAGMQTSTKSIQRQLTKILYLQAAYPVISIVIPCFFYAFVASTGQKVQYIAELAVCTVHSAPAVNALLVLWGMQMFRRRIYRWINKASGRQLFSAGSSSAMGSRKREKSGISTKTEYER